MREHRFGRIVNLGAVGAERTRRRSRKVAAYAAAKAAVSSRSRKALALEEARCGHHRQRGLARLSWRDGDDGRPGVETRTLGDRIPVGRAGCAEDVVRAVLFFCSPAADFVTGQVLAVAGGWRL